MVSLMVLSHSPKIAEGVRDLALQMTPDANIIAIGGTNAGTLGADYDRIFPAMEEAVKKGEVVVLADLGSARLTGQMAREALDGALQEKVFLYDAALVEGAVAAAVVIGMELSAAEVLDQIKDFLLPKEA
jgi:dihydroxyacetone kinase phosphotransfer subunit